MKPYYCESCVFCDEPRIEQPCCCCVGGINFVELGKGENNDEQREAEH